MHDGVAAAVRVEQDESTRVLVMQYGPLNTMVLGIRAGLAQALLDAEMDAATDSVVVIGAGENFCGGADLDEFARGTAMSPPSLHGHIVPFIETMSKPVVAAIEGFALGGGLELALGCHARVAASEARVGLPETNFGLIPGAGGTVRLPRAVGAETAARMIVAAEVLAARDLEATSLFDEVTTNDVRAAALTLARRLAQQGGPLPRLRDVAVAPFNAGALHALRNLPRPSAQATALALDSVLRACESPFDAAVQAEYGDFISLLMANESAALRHLFQATRAAQKVASLPSDLRVPRLRRVGILGTGTLAGDLAQAGRLAGYDIVLQEQEPWPADGDDAVAKSPAFSGCDTVFEAVSTAAGANAPNPFGRVRLHAFGAARVVEVVRGDGVSAEAVVAGMQFVRRIGKSPVCVRPGPGLLVSRLAQRYFGQALEISAGGIPPERIDRALEGFGMRVGPFAAMESVGCGALSLETRARRDRTNLPEGIGGIGTDAPSDDAIARRCVLAMVNEGMRALEDGTAQRPGDIDFAMVEACGFPAAKGGPMFWAETRGLPLTLVEISRLARETGDPFWTPAPTLKNRAIGVSAG